MGKKNQGQNENNQLSHKLQKDIAKQPFTPEVTITKEQLDRITSLTQSIGHKIKTAHKSLDKLQQSIKPEEKEVYPPEDFKLAQAYITLGSALSELTQAWFNSNSTVTLIQDIATVVEDNLEQPEIAGQENDLSSDSLL